MDNTARKVRDDIQCKDCGVLGTEFHHWGIFVPSGECLALCRTCMYGREKYFQLHKQARPVGSVEGNSETPVVDSAANP